MSRGISETGVGSRCNISTVVIVDAVSMGCGGTASPASLNSRSNSPRSGMMPGSTIQPLVARSASNRIDVPQHEGGREEVGRERLRL